MFSPEQRGQIKVRDRRVWECVNMFTNARLDGLPWRGNYIVIPLATRFLELQAENNRVYLHATDYLEAIL